MDNLALACPFCNAKKGTNLAGLDPASGQLIRLFHPREDVWSDNFVAVCATVVPQTPVGRATVAVLPMNDPAQVVARRALYTAQLPPLS